MNRLLGNIIITVLMLLTPVRLAYTGYNGFQNHKADMVISDVAQMIINARAGLSQSNSGYVSSTTTNVPAMTNGDVFPTGMVCDSTVVDLWGNPTMSTSANNAPQDVVSFDDDDSKAVSQCVRVATGMKDCVSLSINGQVFTQMNLSNQATAGATRSTAVTFSVTFQRT